jgi:hypothetical protein
MTSVRTLRPGESMPDGFETGFENMPILSNWVWVSEEEEEFTGILMCGPCHGLVYFMRLCIKPGASKMTALLLLRGMLKDCTKRGYRGFFMHVDPTGEEVNRQLIPLCKRAGGFQINRPQVMLTGSVQRAARF